MTLSHFTFRAAFLRSPFWLKQYGSRLHVSIFFALHACSFQMHAPQQQAETGTLQRGLQFRLQVPWTGATISQSGVTSIARRFARSLRVAFSVSIKLAKRRLTGLGARSCCFFSYSA
eukprot:m.571800 g.571800  ORF g.571800 m.571800 type:complete len:117 (+) comp57862_c0_seq19:199-549(+)